MRVTLFCSFLFWGVMIFPGCQNQSGDNPGQADSQSQSASENPAGKNGAMPAEDAEAVKEIEALASAIKTDKQGWVVEVDFRGTPVTDEQLEPLLKLKKLRSVLLNETPITDQGLKTLGQIGTLTNLDLRDCKITNDGLAHLTGLTNLKALRLSGKNGKTEVDTDGMVHVGKLTNLKALLLDFLWIDGEGLQHLSNCKKIEELYLAETLVADEDLAKLVLFPKLKKLRISKLSQVTGAGLEHVAKIEGLIDLDLSENSSLFDADLAPVSRLTNLKRLNLWRVALTDAGVAHLAPLTNLEWLNLDNTQLSDAGLKYLRGMTKLKFLHLGSTSITDAGLPQLEVLKSLNDLKVTRTAVTDAGVKALKEKLPETEIQLKYLGDG